MGTGTVTASLERSLQNCSLNQTQSSTRIRRGIAGSSSSETSDIINQQHNDNDNDNDDYDATSASAAANASSSSDDNSTLIQLNSHLSLPYHWEQCLDLKTGELYYINWRTGNKVKEDPRTTATGYNGDYDSNSNSNDEDESDNEEDDDQTESETDRSSTESSCWSSQETYRSHKNRQQQQQQLKQAAVLVVAGCKTCLMYHMVPKHINQCPKCCGHLLHFSANNSS